MIGQVRVYFHCLLVAHGTRSGSCGGSLRIRGDTHAFDSERFYICFALRPRSLEHSLLQRGFHGHDGCFQYWMWLGIYGAIFTVSACSSTGRVFASTPSCCATVRARRSELEFHMLKTSIHRWLSNVMATDGPIPWASWTMMIAMDCFKQSGQRLSIRVRDQTCACRTLRVL